MNFWRHTTIIIHPLISTLSRRSLRLFDKLGNYNNKMALRPLSPQCCHWAAHPASHPSPLCARLWDCLLHLLTSTMRLLTSRHYFLRWWSSDYLPSSSHPCVGSIKTLSLPLGCGAGVGGSSLHVRCQWEVFIVHFLRRLYLIWQDFILRGQAYSIPTPAPRPSSPLSSIILDQKREKICSLYFHLAAWSSRWETECVCVC